MERLGVTYFSQLLRRGARHAERRYGERGAVDLTPEGLVANINDLATLPEVALRIARMVEDPNSSSADIGARN